MVHLYRITGLHRPPTLTAGLTAVTAAVSVAGLVAPPVLAALERTPAAQHGQPWRWVTSLLVQDGGVAGTVSNLAFLALLGAAAEQVDRRPAVLARYRAGGLVGQLAGALWQPVGAGNSVAVCGVVGVLACSLSGTRVPAWTGSAVALRLGALLAILWTPLFALGVVGAAADRAVLRSRPRIRVPVFLAMCVTVAVVLTATHNLHGPALAVGTLLGALPARIGREHKTWPRPGSRRRGSAS